MSQLGHVWTYMDPARLQQVWLGLPVVLPEQPLRYMETIIWIDADQMGVEGRVMNFRQGGCR